MRWHVAFLQVALASFYENDEPGLSVTAATVDDTQQTEELQDRTDITSKPVKSDAMSSKGTKPKFGTLNDLQNKDSSSDEEEGQAFYAGGSEHSGQQVLGPGKKKKDIVGDLFNSCQEQRAIGQQRPNTFGGTGYKLSQTNSGKFLSLSLYLFL